MSWSGPFVNLEHFLGSSLTFFQAPNRKRLGDSFPLIHTLYLPLGNFLFSLCERETSPSCDEFSWVIYLPNAPLSPAISFGVAGGVKYVLGWEEMHSWNHPEWKRVWAWSAPWEFSLPLSWTPVSREEIIHTSEGTKDLAESRSLPYLWILSFCLKNTCQFVFYSEIAMFIFMKLLLRVFE